MAAASERPATGPGDRGVFGPLIDNLPSAAYTCDADGLITYYNRLALELWGRAPALGDPADRY